LGAMFGMDVPYERIGRLLRLVVRGMRYPARILAPHHRRASYLTPSMMRNSVPSTHVTPWLDRVMRAIAGAAFVFLALPLFVVIPVSFSSGRYLQFPPPGFSLQWYLSYF